MFVLLKIIGEYEEQVTTPICVSDDRQKLEQEVNSLDEIGAWVKSVLDYVSECRCEYMALDPLPPALDPGKRVKVPKLPNDQRLITQQMRDEKRAAVEFNNGLIEEHQKENQKYWQKLRAYEAECVRAQFGDCGVDVITSGAKYHKYLAQYDIVEVKQI